MTAMARPNPAGREAGEDSYEDDPLVELARIVSGRPGSAGARRRSDFDEDSGPSGFREDSGMTEADLARDLEAELLNDLRSTFAADDDPEEVAYYDEPDDSRPLRPAGADDGMRRDLGGAESYDDADDGGWDEADPDIAGNERSLKDLPEPDFGSFTLRNDPGPAFNPSALSADDYPEAGSGAPIGYSDEEPLLDPEPEPVRVEAVRDAFADPMDWDLDPHPHVAEFAGGRSEPGYFDTAYSYAREDPPQRKASRAAARHRDPRLDADPMGEARYRRRRGRGLLPILGILVIVGLGAASVLILRGGSPNLEPAVIAADPGPTRVFPEPVAAAEPDNLVFNRLNPEAPPPEENLRPPAEPLADLGAPQANDGITQILTPAEPGAVADPDLPRMVRTVTVLTDGTIVNNQTALAGGDAAAANPPPADALVAEPAAPPPANIDPIAVAAVDPPAAAPEPAPGLVPPPADPAPAAAAPQPALAVANLPTAADPIAPGFYVQVTAQASEQAARTQLLDFQARVPGLLANRPAIIQRAELEQGIFYRVKLGPFDARADAIVLLESLRAAGIDGFIAEHR